MPFPGLEAKFGVSSTFLCGGFDGFPLPPKMVALLFGSPRSGPLAVLRSPAYKLTLWDQNAEPPFNHLKTCGLTPPQKKKSEPNGCFRATPQDGAGTAPPPPASAPQSAPHTPPRAPPLTPRGPRVRPARKSAGRSASPGFRVPLACLCWENRFWTKVGWRYPFSFPSQHVRGPQRKKKGPRKEP